MKIETIPTGDLIPYARNAKKHDDSQVAKLAGSIKEFGFNNPVLIDKDNGIIAGHGRIMAAQKLGLENVPCIRLGHLTDTQRRAYILADNRLAEIGGGWDEEMLKLELAELAALDFDISEIGFGAEDLAELEMVEVEGNTDPDEVPEPPVDPVTVLGDVWVLGKHRLMCGDSTSIDAVEKLMDRNRAEITFTSPPYNAGKNIRGNFYENNSDDKSENEYTEFLNAFTNVALSVSDYCFVNLQILESNKRSLVQYQSSQIDRLKDIFVWNKRQFPPHINPGTFGCKWEYVFAFAQSGNGRSFPCKWQGKFSNVIETESNSGNEFAEVHRAGFPIAFPVWMIEKMDFAKSVFDPFMGTGTTMIAAQKLGIKSFGMELDPKYCDVIVKRWQDFTGKKAIHESSGKTFDELKA